MNLLGLCSILSILISIVSLNTLANGASLEDLLGQYMQPAPSKVTVQKQNIPDGWAHVHEKVLTGVFQIEFTSIDPKAASLTRTFNPHILNEETNSTSQKRDKRKELIESLLEEGTGSGGLVQTSRGLRIITNRHVALNGVHFKLKPTLLSYDDKFKIEAELEWISPLEEVDVAFLKINPDEMQKLVQKFKSLGREIYVFPLNSTNTFVGEQLGVTSNPLGQVGSFDIGELGDTHQVNHYSLREITLQNAGPGSSGSIAYNPQGEAVGLVTGMSLAETNSKGIFYLTPMSAIKLALAAMEKDVKKREDLGVTVSSIDMAKAIYLNKMLPQFGIENFYDLENKTARFSQVDSVDKKKIAYKSGLREGDVLLGINDNYILQIDESLADQNAIFLLRDKKTDYLTPLSIVYHLADPQLKFTIKVFRPSTNQMLSIDVPYIVDRDWTQGLSPNEILMSMMPYFEVNGFIFTEVNEAIAKMNDLENGVKGIVIISLDPEQSQFNQFYNKNLVEEVVWNINSAVNKETMKMMLESNILGMNLSHLFSFKPRIFVIDEISGQKVSNLKDLQDILQRAQQMGEEVLVLSGQIYRGTNDEPIRVHHYFYIGKVTQKEIDSQDVNRKLYLKSN
ncbi:MAG: serine protease [Bdellovibrionales bacterium]|nr:serine protease [Bdellovibrionales bacterium]